MFESNSFRVSLKTYILNCLIMNNELSYKEAPVNLFKKVSYSKIMENLFSFMTDREGLQRVEALDSHNRYTWRSCVRSVMHAASQLLGRGSTDVDVAPVPAP